MFLIVNFIVLYDNKLSYSIRLYFTHFFYELFVGEIIRENNVKKRENKEKENNSRDVLIDG